MPWVGFGTKAQWDTFHDAICVDLGIPRPGNRQSDGAVQISNQWTDSQYAPFVIDVIINSNPRKVGILQVPQAVVNAYGLTVISDPTPILDGQGRRTGQWLVTYGGTQYTVALITDPTTLPFRKAKPTTWTDPSDGHVYVVP